MRKYYPDIVSYMLGVDQDGEANRFSLVNEELLHNPNLSEDGKQSLKNIKMTFEGDPWHEENIGGMYRNRVCITSDGILISIQCGEGFYSNPRASFPLESEWLAIYDTFEIGFPSQKIEELMEYAEQPEFPTDTVYAYVPREIVEKFIADHGGITPLNHEETKIWNHRRDRNVEDAMRVFRDTAKEA